MDDPLIADLRQQIANRQPIAIIGAGVSIGATKNAPTASWVGLLKDGVARCEAVGNPRPSSGWGDRQRAALDGDDLDDLLGVAEQVSRKLRYPDGGEWQRWLRETIGMLRANNRPVLEAIRDLGIPIATTNYDGLIEEVTGWPAVTWREGARVERVLRGDEEGVLHLHGYWADPASVVLGIRSYDAVLADAHAQTVLRALRLRQTFVFIGFGAGLDDPNFGELLSWSQAVFSGSEYRHFRLCRSEECDAVQAQHPADQRIFAVPFGAEYDDLAPFLRKLTPATKSPITANPIRVERIGLPPKPARCIGRDSEVETLVSALLTGEPTPVLGPAGIGKSTICLQALHDPRVAERFGARRYFVRCDAATSAEALLAQIGVDLSLEAGLHLSAKVQRHLAEAPAVLVLDNLETPWDQEQLETEEVLKELSGIESLALAATIRGSSRPLGVAWRDALQIAPLSGDDPKRLFLAIAGAKHEKDPHLSRLLVALDGMPLAIELMAHAAEAEPDLEGVWRRWNEQRTEVLKRGKGDNRLLSLGVSLELSIASARMDDSARRLLSMLALLPNGIARRDINTLLPGCGDAAGAILRKLALAFDEAGILRCLAPIREYIASSHPPSLDDYDTLLTHQTYLMKSQYDLMVKQLESEESDEMQFSTEAAKKILENQIRVLLHALSIFQTYDRPSAQAHCLLALAYSSNAVDKFDDAQEYADKALVMHRQLGDTRREADCIKLLNEIAQAKSSSA